MNYFYSSNNDMCPPNSEEAYWDYLMDEAEKNAEYEAEADFSAFGGTKENSLKPAAEE